MNIWITSDTHYDHTNIAGPKVSNWNSGYRNFNNTYEMNKALIEGINSRVKENDVLYHLGDWSFGNIVNIYKFRSKIICKNIHLIRGNHDEKIFDSQIVRRDISFNPITLFKSINEISTIHAGKHSFFLSHYAHRVWNKSHHGRIHLYGHSHGSIPDYGLSMDVGVDVAYRLFGEYRPFHINEIIQIMSDRKMEIVDHHK